MTTLYPKWDPMAACPHIQVDRRVRLEMATRIAAGLASDADNIRMIAGDPGRTVARLAFEIVDTLLQEANR